VNQTFGHFWKQLALINDHCKFAMKCGQIKHLDTVFNMTTIYCSDHG